MALSSWQRGSVYDAAWLLASDECTQTHLLSGNQFVLSSDKMQVRCMALTWAGKHIALQELSADKQ